MIEGPVVAKIAATKGEVAPATPVHGITTRVIRGSLWTLSGQGVTLLASFISIPFVIRLLGSEAYGVLALINVLIGYIGFADFGMGAASTRFGADAYARQNEGDENAVVWTALLISFGLAASSALMLALFADPLVERVLRLPEHLHREAVFALRLAAIGFVARSVSGVLNTPQVVRLRMDLNALITTGTGVAQICFIPLVLLLGGGLVAAVSVTAGAAVITALAHLVVSGQLLPRLFKPRISSALIKPLMKFGSGLVVSSLASIVLIHAEKLLLARLSSVTALAHYSVAYAVAGLLALAPAAITQSLLPAFSRLQASHDLISLERLYTRALRGNLLWVTPVALALCALAKPFFTLWAGLEYGQHSVMPFYILVGGIFFNVMAIVPYTLLMASGRSDLIARIHLSELLPYIICTFILTYLFGAVGAAVSYSLRLIVDALIFFFVVKRSGFSFSIVPANRASYLAAVAVMSLPILLSLSDTVSSSTALICVTILSLFGYSYLTWNKILTSEERAWVNSMLRYPKGLSIIGNA